MRNERINNLVEQKDLRRKLRRKSTPEEIALWKVLKGKQVAGCQFRRQFSVGVYVLDFYCPKAKLCVEVDGMMHHSEENQKHDKARDAFLATRGIEVLRVDNQALWSCSDLVVATIQDRLKVRLADKNSPSKLEGVPEGRGRVSLSEWKEEFQ
ncbi:MAG: DUF559 domain-containing protein [Tidjanibacter sp.]|nr:DUF559 domain-containing protein [Tidjanibacter sp.]